MAKLKKGSFSQGTKQISSSSWDCTAGAELLGHPAQVGNKGKKSLPVRVQSGIRRINLDVPGEFMSSLSSKVNSKSICYERCD